LLDPAIRVRAGTDLDDVWRRFEVFEALHHSMQICNPMTSTQLDEVIAAVGIADGAHIVDYACGYGEVLFRAAQRACVRGVGVDLSPWMITRAAAQAGDRSAGSTLRWVLGEARDYRPASPCDVAVCIGAEWVWHDFRGTARALAERLQSGGVAVIGAARLHTAADPDRVRRQRGAVETVADQRALLEHFGFEPLHRVDPDDAGWDAYLARTAAAARDWAVLHPGQASDQWLAEQDDWQQAREHDREVIGWSVWVARQTNKVSTTRP